MRGGGDMGDRIFKALVIVHVIACIIMFMMAPVDAKVRKSKPPVKIKDPNGIHRKDICEADYDRARGADKGVQYYVQAQAQR